MADKASEQVKETMQIPVDQIALNPALRDLRQNRGSAKNKKYIEQLADSFLNAGGQTQPVLVRSNTIAEGDGSECPYELVYGYNRFDAAKHAGIPLLAIFEDLSDAEARQKALHENIQRKNFTPLELARIIKAEQDGGKSSKEIAEYLGIDKATVTQTVKLLDLPADLQKQVEDEKITKSAALEFSVVKDPVKRDEAIKVAGKAAETEAKAKAKAAPAPAKKKGEGDKTPAPAPAPTPKIETKHAREAIRKTAAVEKPKAPSRAEIISMFEQLSGPAFCTPMSDAMDVTLGWIAGEVTDKQFKEAWDDLNDVVPPNKTDKHLAIMTAIEKHREKLAAAKMKAAGA